MLLTLMMLPLPLAAIPGANAATRKNAARTLLANRASNVATSRSDVAPVTRAFWPWRLRGWVAGTVALRNLVVDKPLGAHNSVVSVMVPDRASVDPSGANTPRCAADLVMIRAPCVYLASRGPPLRPSLEPRACL